MIFIFRKSNRMRRRHSLTEDRRTSISIQILYDLIGQLRIEEPPQHIDDDDVGGQQDYSVTCIERGTNTMADN